MKKQEQDILRSMYADLIEAERKNNGNFSKVLSNQEALNKNCGVYSTKILKEIGPVTTSTVKTDNFFIFTYVSVCNSNR